MTGTPGTLLPSGRQVSVQVTNSLFSTLADATIVAANAWLHDHNYAVVGERATNNGNIYQVITAGMSAHLGGPGGTGLDIVDLTVHWEFVGVGTGFVDAAMASISTGPIVAVARTLSQIQTPIAGWNTAVNLSDATLGAAAESDAKLRLRREAELHGAGLAALEAIRAAILKVSGVTSCTVFENVTDVVNGDGMPPHSVEVLAQGGDPTDIVKAIFKTVGAGINTTGNQAPINVTDSQGIVHAIKFSRPALVSIWVIANVLFDSAKLPSGGTAAVQASVTANILAYGGTLTVDFDVFSSQIAAAIIAGVPSAQVAGIVGILDPGAPLIGLAPAPGSRPQQREASASRSCRME